MTDVTQGADALDDRALFDQASDADAKTLADFENPKLPIEDKPVDKPVDKVDDKTTKPTDKPTEPVKEEPPVPAGRLREEMEARRRVERQLDELLRQRQSPPQQPQTPPKKPDVFENPEAFVMSLVQPLLEQQEQARRIENENRSMDRAAERFGPEMVAQSRQFLEQGMQRGDPMAWAVYNQAMKSHDPYGVIAGWHYERAMLHHIGGDLNAFRKREREEALKDPDYLKQALERAKQTASSNGSFKNQPPVKPVVPNMPSLGNIGAGGGDTQVTEPSDIELFRAATSAKRR